ncbi:N-6 DNA methylase [Sinosporangium siamense]|uniref:Type II restriction endonuclease subunit M n=1 Tax=Sinosporangium siamense TaxID=1367973 RepID=A0A919RE09_9ACTN|nr:N-6 DNA methylase [Sinosporangium siamense]GII92155.1 type II restriction endonuclease subunit M [Sinosporangium siamense]
MKPGESATVAAGDIARLAGVGRAAVSNWRRRFGDFPQPVGGTTASPLFSLDEVHAWLRGQGKLRELPEDELLWQQIRNSVDDLQLLSLVSRLAAAMAHGKPRSLLRMDDEGIAEALPGLIVDEGDTALIRATSALAKAKGTAETVEFLYTRYTEAHSRRVQVLPPEVAKLMAAFVEPGATEVFDPSCGFGGLLLALAAREDTGVTAVSGQERGDDAGRLAGARLAVRGITADIRSGDALRHDAFPGLRADAAVCAPPFNERGWGYEELANDTRWEFGLPPRGESELAWVQHCLARVRSGGQAIVLMPPAVADRRSGRRIRSHLLRAGALQAVVSLPAGSAPQSAMPPHLWLLRRPHTGDTLPSHVLMVDSSEGLSPGTTLSAWWSFRRGEEVDSDACRTVPIIDLLDDEVDLTPARHLPKAASVRAVNLHRIRDGLLTLAGELATSIPGAVPDGTPLAMVTVADLAKAGVLQVEQTPMRMETKAGDLPLLTAEDIAAGCPASGSGAAGAAAVLGRPGDVVVPSASRQVTARVLDDEVALGPNVSLIRVDPEVFDPYFVAGFLRAATLRASGTATGSHRVDVRRAQIPRLPLSEQVRYGTAFRQLEHFEDVLRRTGETGDLLRRLILAGLTDGDLRPDP